VAKPRRYQLHNVDDVSYIPFDQDSANLFFQLVFHLAMNTPPWC
jgi:DNA replication protein DnaC